jgi:hypothetical protein
VRTIRWAMIRNRRLESQSRRSTPRRRDRAVIPVPLRPAGMSRCRASAAAGSIPRVAAFCRAIPERSSTEWQLGRRVHDYARSFQLGYCSRVARYICCPVTQSWSCGESLATLPSESPRSRCSSGWTSRSPCSTGAFWGTRSAMTWESGFARIVPSLTRFASGHLAHSSSPSRASAWRSSSAYRLVCWAAHHRRGWLDSGERGPVALRRVDAILLAGHGREALDR